VGSISVPLVAVASKFPLGQVTLLRTRRQSVDPPWIPVSIPFEWNRMAHFAVEALLRPDHSWNDH
jgi:hypothetical protein